MENSTLLHLLTSVLLVVGGFLLNRVFNELDVLRKADQSLAKEIADLRPSLIGRESFDRHVDREERLIASLQASMDEHRRLLADLSLRLVAHLAATQAQPQPLPPAPTNGNG